MTTKKCVRNLLTPCESLVRNADNVWDLQFDSPLNGITLQLNFQDKTGVSKTYEWATHTDAPAGLTQWVGVDGDFDALTGSYINYSLFNITDGAAALILSGRAAIREVAE